MADLRQYQAGLLNEHNPKYIQVGERVITSSCSPRLLRRCAVEGSCAGRCHLLPGGRPLDPGWKGRGGCREASCTPQFLKIKHYKHFLLVTRILNTGVECGTFSFSLIILEDWVERRVL